MMHNTRVVERWKHSSEKFNLPPHSLLYSNKHCSQTNQLFLHLCITITRRYGPIRGPTSSSCEGLGPATKAFWPFAQKNKNWVFMLFWPIFGNFGCPVVTLVTFSSNLSNLEINPKQNKKIQKKIQKFPKNSENPKKIQEI